MTMLKIIVFQMNYVVSNLSILNGHVKKWRKIHRIWKCLNFLL